VAGIQRRRRGTDHIGQPFADELDIFPERWTLVDDVATLGGTLAEMAHHIQENGGMVVGITTMTTINLFYPQQGETIGLSFMPAYVKSVACVENRITVPH